MQSKQPVLVLGMRSEVQDQTDFIMERPSAKIATHWRLSQADLSRSYSSTQRKPESALIQPMRAVHGGMPRRRGL